MIAADRADINRTRRRRAAAVGAGAVGLAVIASPTAWLDAAIAAIAAVMPIATAPIDWPAREMLALGGAGLTAIVIWSALFLSVGRRGGDVPVEDDTPVVRRADAHPDAPPRKPLTAAALGGHAVPRDLDTPLSAMDPGAIMAEPRQPLEPVAPLATRELKPTPASAQESSDTMTDEPPPPSIDALMRRLGAE